MFNGIDPSAVSLFLDSQNEELDQSLGEGGDSGARVQFLKDSIKIDPGFHMAYINLVNAYIGGFSRGRYSFQEARTAASSALNHAIELAPDDDETLFQLGQLQLLFDLDYASAEANFEHNLRLFPKFGYTYIFLATIALREGRAGDALRLVTNASEYDVWSERAAFLGQTSSIRLSGGDYGGALTASAEGLKHALSGRERPWLLRLHATCLILLGRAEDAKPFIEKGWGLESTANPEAYIHLFAGIGKMNKSKQILAESGLKSHSPKLARAYLSLGDIDSSLRSIKTGIQNHDPALLNTLLVAEWWQPVRDDPRYDEIFELLDSRVTHTEQYLRDR